jgi:protein O-mannosyl-transferase
MMEGTRRRALAMTVVACSAVLAYLNALGNPPVYDDLLRLGRPADLFSPRPLTELSNLLDRLLFRDGVVGPHLVSVLLHALASALVCALAWSLVAGAHRYLASLAAGLCFALHPLQTEAVGYVSARADVLAGAASLGATLAWLRWRKTGARVAATSAAVLLILALLAKETAAALPLAWLVGELALGDRNTSVSQGRRLRFTLAFVTLMIAAGAARIVLYVAREGGALPGLGHAFAQAEVAWRYLGLFLLPRGQTLYHGAPLVVAAKSWRAWLALFGLMAVVSIALVAALRRRPVGFAVLWFVLLLLPSAALPLKDAMAEHRVYLASAGLTLVVALAVAHLPGRVATVSVAVLAVLLAGATGMRNRAWRSPIGLWTEATHAAPRAWPPYHALGDALRAAGRCGEALDAYAQAIRRGPSQLAPHVNRALCFAQLGRLDEADAELSGARLLAPKSSIVANGQGVVALRQGRRDEARAFFLEALAFDPGNAVARANLDALPVR